MLMRELVPFCSALIAYDSHIYAVGSDRTLRQIEDSGDGKLVEDPYETLTQICISHMPQRVLFAGTETGSCVAGASRTVSLPDPFLCACAVQVPFAPSCCR